MKLALTVIPAAFCLCFVLISCGEKEPAPSVETDSSQLAPEKTPAPTPEPEETPEPKPELEKAPEPKPEPEETSEPKPEPEETGEPAAKRRNRSEIAPPAIIDRTVQPVAPASR